MRPPAELEPVILRVLVGSQAHGIARPDSDFDYSEVFVSRTGDLLQIPVSARPKDAWGTEDKRQDDEKGWEVAKFLQLATIGHPNSIELFFAPVEEEHTTEDGHALRELSGLAIAAERVLTSHLGYAKNCMNKLLDHRQRSRQAKWKSTYLRILFAGRDFLRTGDLPFPVPLEGDDPWGLTVLRARDGEMTVGEVVDLGHLLEVEIAEAATSGVVRETPDLPAINEWLMELRKRSW